MVVVGLLVRCEADCEYGEVGGGRKRSARAGHERGFFTRGRGELVLALTCQR